MKRIMIVEDERIVAEDIRRSLENLGYTVSAMVSSGEEAIEKAEDNPDLVLMDIVLRGDMDGIETAQQLKSQFNIPVVYLTAYADDKKLQRAIVTEPYGYLLKPFEDRELHTAIEMALYKHEMEKKVRESQQWLATTLKSIGDGVIATDTEGLVTFMNPVAEVLTGWNQKEAAGKPLKDVFYIINEETRERCENPFEKILETGGIVGLANNTVLVAKDGTEKPIADSGAPIRDETHTILGTVLVFRDITEKRKMEGDILRLKTEKMESISILAGGIAHDFNNILTAILGNITLAKMHTVPEGEIFTILTEAEKASLRAKNLTQQLLTFSKDGVLIKKPASISELLQDTAEFALHGSNAECKFLIPEDLWSVDIDAGKISQVINNLIINADQAMPEGGIIEVSAENVRVEQKEGLPLQGGTYVKISIEDRGIGIPEEYLQKIFEPYFTTKQKGSGLGLATSYSIVKKHGGHIVVTSKSGAGTLFCIWLPALEKGADIVSRGRKPERLVRGKGRILVMDDDVSILKVTRDVLEHLGYTPAFARQELLKIDPSVKAIVSSGYSNDPVMANYREYGFCGVVTKPYSIEELSKTLHEVINVTP